MNFKFTVGQWVEYCPADGLPGRYNVIRLMPVEPYYDEPYYRIRGERAGDEWVVIECNLSVDVGTTQYYETIAQQLKGLRRQRAPIDVPAENRRSEGLS
jgi:hypothetical protein